MERFAERRPFPLAGHKCLGARKLYETSCECGWYSDPDPERAVVYRRWRNHLRDHGAEMETLKQAEEREARERAKLYKQVGLTPPQEG